MTEIEKAEDMPRTDEDWRNYVAKSLRAGEIRMNKLEEGIAANTAEIQNNTKITEELKEKTAEFLDVFNAVKGGFKVLGWFGTALKWLGAAAAALTAIYGFVLMIIHFFTGHLPPK